VSKSISCCPLTSKSTDIINYNCFRLWQNFSFFSCTLLGQCLFLFWFRQDDFFHWIKQYNRLVFYLEVKVWSSKYLIDNFVYYKHFFYFFFYFIRHSLMDWSHEDYLWIIVMFDRCVDREGVSSVNAHFLLTILGHSKLFTYLFVMSC